jgi:hypothetical protein
VIVFAAHSVVLLVVEADAGWVLGDSFVFHGLDKVFAFLDDDGMLNIRIFFILDFEVVGWELLDGEVGGQDSSVFSDNVSSLSYSSRG